MSLGTCSQLEHDCCLSEVVTNGVRIGKYNLLVHCVLFITSKYLPPDLV